MEQPYIRLLLPCGTPVHSWLIIPCYKAEARLLIHYCKKVPEDNKAIWTITSKFQCQCVDSVHQGIFLDQILHFFLFQNHEQPVTVTAMDWHAMKAESAI